MRKLIGLADVVTPNVTELCHLLELKHQDIFTMRKIKSHMKQLSLMDPQIVVVTSVATNEANTHAQVYAYNSKKNEYWRVTTPHIPAQYTGTGDTSTSVLTGSLPQGDTLPIALERAV